jgi:protein-disulfide isomerase
MKSTLLTIACSALALSLVDLGQAHASTSSDLQELKQEVQTLRQGQEQIQKDLAEIKQLLQQGARAAPGQQPFRPADFVVGSSPTLGSADAPVTLVEFSDYQCPFCKRHAAAVMPELIESYVDTGKVRFVMRESPIEGLHPRAVAAAEAALCAGDQGQYWEMSEALFNDQKANTDEDFNTMAEDLGLDVTAFTQCTGSDKHLAQIKADQAEAQKLGISGTPSFVLGLTDPKDPNKVRLTKFIRGAQPLAAFAAEIDELIKSVED